MSDIIVGDDNISRCEWCAATSEYIHYHDTEWGFPVSDDYHLFEKICLESFQSGLSWRTILAKRENFRKAFLGFDFDRIALFTEHDINSLLQNAGIVRHRGKIEAVINNAKRAQLMIQEQGSLGAYFWQYEPGQDELAIPQTISTSKESIALSKDMKKRGWKFVGPTTIYAFMQAMGIVNDHVEDCETWAKVENARKTFKRPCGKN
jgi:DNA-3-methyladenine glycosylase I